MSDKTVILYTNIFTLKDKDVKHNRYIDMYYVWLYNIIKYKCLDKNDICITLVDSITYNTILENEPFRDFKKIIPNLLFIEYPQPENIKEGILQRYNIDRIMKYTNNIVNPYYMHLDVDVLPFKNLRELFKEPINNNKTTIYISPELKLLSNDYYGELITEDDMEILRNKKMLDMPGFSAGIFGWTNSKDIQHFFRFILEKARTTDKPLYTVEQPFFNSAIFHYLFKEIGIFNFILQDKNKISINEIGGNNNKSTVLINFCGVPGDDSLHWNKILFQYFFQEILKQPQL
jgi:hypothetical protein